MPLSRISLRSLIPVRQTCARCFSTSRHAQNAGLLDILSGARGGSPTQKKTGKSLTGVARDLLPDNPTFSRQVAESEQKASYQRQIYRKWQAGDVYAPHDLSGQEQKKWKKGRKTPQSDAFDTLGINPVNEYKNFTMMSEYMTEMGRIKHSRETGLRPKNQRKIAKAIRRAVGLGLMPSVHRHPLVLKKSSPTRFL